MVNAFWIHISSVKESSPLAITKSWKLFCQHQCWFLYHSLSLAVGILRLLQALTDVKGNFPVDETLSDLPFGFWYILQVWACMTVFCGHTLYHIIPSHIILCLICPYEVVTCQTPFVWLLTNLRSRIFIITTFKSNIIVIHNLSFFVK